MESACRPRYVLLDHAVALAAGSAALGLPAPADLEGALSFLLALYRRISVVGSALDLGELDTLLEPFVADRTDEALDARLLGFWRALAQEFPGAAVHATLGPRDGRAVRAILRVDRELRQAGPDLTLRVGPGTPASLLREAVLTVCADGKPNLVDDAAIAAALGPAYGLTDGHHVLPRGGGAHAQVCLDLADSVRAATGGSREYLAVGLPRAVGPVLAVLAARTRSLVEHTGWYSRDWAVREGLLALDRFTAILRLDDLAGAVAELLVRDGAPGPAPTELATALVARVAELVSTVPLPYCAATGGRALVYAEGACPVPAVAPVPAPVPAASGAQTLYDRLRAAAPTHPYLTGGAGDVVTFEPAVEANPDSVIAVLRGAFAAGMRDFTADVAGNGFARVTGYLQDQRDVAALRAAAAVTVAQIRAGQRPTAGTLSGHRPTAGQRPTAGSVREGLVAGTVPFSAVDGPGNRFAVFLQGCGWDCLVCHNPCSIPLRPPAMATTRVEDVVAQVRDVSPFLTGVTVTGGEATLQAGFVQALFAELAADPCTAGLSRFVDSNGDADPAVWQGLAPLTDGVMLDLKALDDDMHVVLTGHGSRRVLASIAELAGRGLLYEVRLLLVPGLNDADAVLRRTAEFLLAVDPGVRVRVNAFRRAGARAVARDLLEPTEADLRRYRSVLTAAGIRDLTLPVAGPPRGCAC